ncbi:type VI secretion system-associated protein TagO [Halomonas sp. LR3S48]|uniref:type VI secretion system-associated protein TagO n=1 Tax=Halomonas sp. LR3S48 TaxID=2982694 RepID=UPI00398EB970
MVLVVFGGIFLYAILADSPEDPKRSTPRNTQAAVAQDTVQKEEAEEEVREPSPPPSPWSISRDVSPIDDSPSVWLTTRSHESVSHWLGKPSRPAKLSLRCMENTTTLILDLNENHMASIQGYGDAIFRVDSRQAFTLSMQESTNNQVLGLWSGGRSIPAIRRLFDAEQVTVRATPYNQGPITVTFPIRELKDEIAPLREACNW